MDLKSVRRYRLERIVDALINAEKESLIYGGEGRTIVNILFSVTN